MLKWYADALFIGCSFWGSFAVQPIKKKKFLTFFPKYLHSFHLKNSVLVILKMAKRNISLIIVSKISHAKF